MLNINTYSRILNDEETINDNMHVHLNRICKNLIWFSKLFDWRWWKVFFYFRFSFGTGYCGINLKIYSSKAMNVNARILNPSKYIPNIPCEVVTNCSIF